MKQKNLFKGFLAITVLLCTTHTWAYDFSAVNDEGVTIYYNILDEDDLTCEVTGRNTGSSNQDSYMGEVVIAETTTYLNKTYSVVAVGNYAFRYCTKLTKIIISSSVTSIGDYAFYECSNLTEVTIGNSVLSIGNYAFYYCSSLTEVTIPNSVTTIGAEAFWRCSKLTSLTLGDNVTTIGNSAFYHCSSLTEVTIPNSVTEIGSSAFYYCTGLTSVTIGNSVTSIGNSAFYHCSSLTEVTIPNSVTEIGSSAFGYCTGLTSLTLGNSVTEIGSSAFESCSSLTELSIPNSVTSIGNSAFNHCTGLTSLTLGNSVTEIGSSAFKSSTSLTQVHYNAIACASNDISSDAFNNCTNINDVIIGENVQNIPQHIFNQSKNLVKLVSCNVVPPTFEDATFGSVIMTAEVPIEALQNYALAEKWTDIPIIYSTIEGNMYYPVPISYVGEPMIVASGGDENGVALTEGATATISSIEGQQVSGIVQYGVNDVTDTINGSGQYSFTVSQYHKINTVYSYAVTTDNVYDLTVEQAGEVLNQITVNKINDVYYLKVRGEINGDDVSTIRRMPNLMVLDLSDANIVSGGGAYYGTNKTADNVFGSYFFTDLSNLRYVVLPNNVTSIGSYAFKNCDGLTAMVIPSKVGTIGTSAFSGCTNLMNLSINTSADELNLTENSSGTPFSDCPLVSVYVDRNMKYSYRNSSNSTYYYYVSPFENKTTLVSAIIGDNATEIGINAFSGCKNLTNLTIGNSVETISDKAFYQCTSLTEVTFPNSVIEIGSSASEGCTGLTEVVIPNSVTSIENYAFRDCTGLTELTLEDGEETLSITTSSSATPFTNCPIETLYLGRNISYNGEYSPFRGNNNLTSLTIGMMVTYIPTYEFYGCSSLTVACFPYSVTKIESYTFYRCTGLTEVTIGESVTSIDIHAFQGCSNLATINSANPTPPDIKSSTFSGVDKETCILNIPIGSLNAYWVHVYWGEFFNIKEVDFPDGIKDIPNEENTNMYGGDNYQIYSLSGVRVTTPIKGNVYIFKYSDGTARKVFLK